MTERGALMTADTAVSGQDSAHYHVRPDVVDCPLDGGLAVLNLRSGTCFSLNRSAAVIWNGARKPARFSELSALLSAEYAGEDHDFDSDLRRLLTELADAGLMSVAAPL